MTPAPEETATRDESVRPRVGVSSCLLGENVRFNGGHKRDRFLTDTLGPFVDWNPVCPEVEMGLGTPRPTLRLVADAAEEGRARLYQPNGDRDRTAAMQSYSDERIRQADLGALDGYIFKKDSPTCGVFRVKVYDAQGMPTRRGRGLWAETVLRAHPTLPAEEEGRLNDPLLRENFVLRLFTRARWRRLQEAGPTPAALVAFHTRNKLCLMAHQPEAYRALGRLVADAGSRDLQRLLTEYEQGLMRALGIRASRGRHVNVLQHVAGFLKRDLGAADKKELESLLQDYRHGLVPLIVPVTLLRHLIRRHEADAWLQNQAYLDPYPAELMLRNVV